MDPLLLATLGVAGLLAALLMVPHPFLSLVLAGLSVLFGPTLVQVTGVAQLSSLDEAMVLWCFVLLTVRRAAAGHRLRKPSGFGWLVLALLVGVVSSVWNGVPAGTSASAGFLLMKGPMLGFAAAQLDWTRETLERVHRILVGLLVFLVGCAFFNLAAPDAWAGIFSSTDSVDYRSRFASVIGPFTQPGFMGQVTGLAVVALFALGRELGRGGRLITALGVVAAVMTFRRKTWVSLPLALAAVFGLRRKTELALLAVPLAVVGIIVAWGPITTTVEETRYEYFGRSTDVIPRVLMYEGAADIAARDFPLGAGLGRWGSTAAFDDYSPEYYARGFQKLDGLAPTDELNYATDTFWPAVVGENGWVGTLFYATGLLVMLRAFRRASKRGGTLARAVGMVGVGWWVLLVIESFAAPVFTGPPVYPWLFVAAGALAAVRSGDVGDPLDAEGVGRQVDGASRQVDQRDRHRVGRGHVRHQEDAGWEHLRQPRDHSITD